MVRRTPISTRTDPLVPYTTLFRSNLFSWYLYIVGGLFTIACLLLGGVDTGWTFYTPFSTMFSNSNVMLAVVGVFVVGFSSIFTGLNFIVTIHTKIGRAHV